MCHVVDGTVTVWTCEKESQGTGVKLGLFPDPLRTRMVAPVPPRNPPNPKLGMGGDTHSHTVATHLMGKGQMYCLGSLSLSFLGQPRSGAPQPTAHGA